jgi:hypothetical protein
VSQVGLGIDGLAPGKELVGPEAIALLAEPGEIEAAGPLLARADAVLPVIGGGEVASRPAHDRDAEGSAGVDHVPAQPLVWARTGQGQRGALVEHAALDVAEEVGLKEVPIDVGVDPPDLPVGTDVDGDRHLAGAALLLPGLWVNHSSAPFVSVSISPREAS